MVRVSIKIAFFFLGGGVRVLEARISEPQPIGFLKS